MADTFSNDLRLRLQESGSNAGTWGDLLNGTITNIASGFGQGSEAIPNASTHTITLADGTADEARSLYLKCTGGGQACTVTLGPNTISKVWIIDNATSYTLTFSQGSGANVAIAAGAVKVIATDGAGSGAAVVDTLDGLEGSFSSLAVTGEITANGGIALGDNDRATFGASDDLQIYHDGSSSYITDAGTGNLYIDSSDTVIRANGAENSAKFIGNGRVELYYDAVKKFETTSTGIDVTGSVTATGFQVGTMRLHSNQITSGYTEDSEDADVWINYTGYAGGATRFRDFRVGNGKQGQVLMVDGSSGSLLVGTTSQPSSFRMFVDSGANSSVGIRGSATTYNAIVFYTPASATAGFIQVSGSTTSYNQTSDYRLKENVVAITGATERLKQLNPSRFNFIADANTTVDGFLAHEVQDVVPEAITGTKDAMRDEEYEVTPAVLDDDGNVTTEAVMGTRSVPDYQGIDQSKLVPLLVATIQELEARLTALENT